MLKTYHRPQMGTDVIEDERFVEKLCNSVLRDLVSKHFRYVIYPQFDKYAHVLKGSSDSHGSLTASILVERHHGCDVSRHLRLHGPVGTSRHFSLDTKLDFTPGKAGGLVQVAHNALESLFAMLVDELAHKAFEDPQIATELAILPGEEYWMAHEDQWPLIAATTAYSCGFSWVAQRLLDGVPFDHAHLNQPMQFAYDSATLAEVITLTRRTK
jgi:hypothetical protein